MSIMPPGTMPRGKAQNGAVPRMNRGENMVITCVTPIARAIGRRTNRGRGANRTARPRGVRGSAETMAVKSQPPALSRMNDVNRVNRHQRTVQHAQNAHGRRSSGPWKAHDRVRTIRSPDTDVHCDDDGGLTMPALIAGTNTPAARRSHEPTPVALRLHDDSGTSVPAWLPRSSTAISVNGEWSWPHPITLGTDAKCATHRNEEANPLLIRVPGSRRNLFRCLPEAERTVSGGQLRRDRAAAGLEVEPQL